MVRRTQTMVQLTDELVARLDDEASRQGLSRSALVREVLVEHLAQSHQAAITKRIVDGYRRVPPGTPDECGNLDAQTDRATRETLQRLDSEERAQGHEPW